MYIGVHVCILLLHMCIRNTTLFTCLYACYHGASLHHSRIRLRAFLADMTARYTSFSSLPNADTQKAVVAIGVLYVPRPHWVPGSI